MFNISLWKGSKVGSDCLRGNSQLGIDGPDTAEISHKQSVTI
jgi:hypothetical protein